MKAFRDREWKVQWRSGKDTVRIVLIKDSITQKFNCYIGVAQNYSEWEDAEYIANWGARLTFKEAKAFFPELEMSEFDE